MKFFYVTNFLKFIFYFCLNFSKQKPFVILIPAFISVLFKKTLIFDKNKKKVFSIKIRNKYDIITVFEIFGQDFYNIKDLKISDKIADIISNITKKNLKPLIIDCGANIGCSGMYFKKLVDNSAVINIEPDDNNFLLLSENCRSADFENIKSAVSSKEIFFEVINTHDDNRAYKIKRIEVGNKKTVTIEKIIKYKKSNLKPFLIKFDIEGFEKDVFSENTNWIQEFKVIIIEIHDWMLPGENCSENLLKVISKMKKDLILSGENLIIINNNYKL